MGKSPTESHPFLVPGKGKLRSLHQLPVTSTQWCTGGSFIEDKARHEAENSRPRRGQGSEKTASRQGNHLKDYTTASTCCLTWLAAGECRTTWSTASTSVSGRVMHLFDGNVYRFKAEQWPVRLLNTDDNGFQSIWPSSYTRHLTIPGTCHMQARTYTNTKMHSRSFCANVLLFWSHVCKKLVLHFFYSQHIFTFLNIYLFLRFLFLKMLKYYYKTTN